MADATEAQAEDMPPLTPWRLTMKPPLVGVVYEVGRPVPGNPMLNTDTHKPLRGMIRRIALIDTPPGTPDLYRVLVEPVDAGGKAVTNGFPDADRPVSRGAKLCLDHMQVIEVQKQDVAEAVFVASKAWADAHEDDLQDDDEEEKKGEAEDEEDEEEDDDDEDDAPAESDGTA